jgi:hypothetical protein
LDHQDWNNPVHQISRNLIMADRSDKPPILRALVLLVALVSTALALAALSPPSPAPVDPAPAAGPAANSTTALQATPSRP